MAESTPRINYTARDYETNLQALREFVQSQAPESWTSFFKGDLGEVLLEAIAYDATMQSFTLDMQTQECFIDTLTSRESLLHFSRLTGYTLRRATAVSLQVYARAAAPPNPTDLNYLVSKGTQVRSKDGQLWEVADNYVIAPGNFTPVRIERQFGDVTGRNLDPNGVATMTSALVKLVPGSAMAVLCQPNGTRWPSDVNFGPAVSQGSILKLLNQQTGQTGNVTTSYGNPPDYTRDEYAIIEVGRMSYDIFDHTVLYLDRPWQGSGPFIGKWRIENRNITIIQGETRHDTFQVPTGANTKSYRITPFYYPVLSGTAETFLPAGFFGRSSPGNTGVQVYVNQVLWTPTSSLLFETPDAQAYEVRFDELDRMEITFGDGKFGAQLSPESVIEVIYRVGGGASGNLPQNSVDTTISASIAGQPSTPVTIFLSNPYTVGNGGQARESISDAKRNIPQFIRTNDRAVTVEDYAFLASNFVDAVAGRIKLAKGVLHQNVVPREQNVVWVYSWVQGPNGQLAPPTYTLKARLLDYLNQRKLITDEVVVVDGVTTSVPIHIRFRISKQADPSETTYKVQAAVNSVFVSMQPGETLYMSRLYEAISAVPEVEYIDFYSPQKNLSPKSEFDLYANTLQLPQKAKLLYPAARGATTLTISSPTLFTAKGLVGLFEQGRTPTSAVIDSIQGNVILLRTPLVDTYSTDANCVNSDFLPFSWQYERPVNLFVRYLSGGGTSISVTANIRRVLNSYFREVLEPEQALVRSILEDKLRAIPDIADVTVDLNTIDSPIEQVTPSSNEIITMGVLSINSQIQ